MIRAAVRDLYIEVEVIRISLFNKYPVISKE